MTEQLIMGNAAFAHAALSAGVTVVAGYPGTPSSEVIETIAAEHDAGRAQGVHVEWSTNEKAALELLAGASYAGARTLYTSKQMGLNVASDALMSLNYVGCEGGTVLLVADDPGPISSQTEQDTRRYASFAKVPVFDPATPEQGCEMMAAAFDLSEKYRTPVLFRPTTRVCHASTFFPQPEPTVAKEPEGFSRDSKFVIFPPRAYAGHKEINDRLVAIAEDFSNSDFNPTFTQGDAPSVGIVTGGISTAYAREALRMIEQAAHAEGVTLPAYRFMQVGTPYPFPQAAAADFIDGLDRVIVFEELDYVLEDEFAKLVGREHADVDVFGKLTGHTLDRGENSIDVIFEQLASFFGLDRLIAERPTTAPASCEIPARPPVLCAGCPHRGSFYAVKKAIGRQRDAVLCGDIGCYTLGNALPLDMVDTCLCMGAGISMAQGFSIVEKTKKAVAFVGDSTFFASGMTGVANAVYNKHDITIMVLDNSTTAMTGDQPHPGTGKTLMGPHSTPIDIEGVLKALGVEFILHADPLFLTPSTKAAQEAIGYDGPSAVIFESPCVNLRKPQPPVRFAANACAGCRRCVSEIGCPALSFNKVGKSVAIDQSLCSGCGLCTDLCMYSAITTPERHKLKGVLPAASQRVDAEDGSLSLFKSDKDKLERDRRAREEIKKRALERTTLGGKAAE